MFDPKGSIRPGGRRQRAVRNASRNPHLPEGPIPADNSIRGLPRWPERDRRALICEVVQVVARV